MAEGGCLPAAGNSSSWDDGVIYEGQSYRREDDGLAYERMDCYLNRGLPGIYSTLRREELLKIGIVLP